MGQVTASDSFTVPVRQPPQASQQYLFKDTIGRDVTGTWGLSPAFPLLFGDPRKVTGQNLFPPLKKTCHASSAWSPLMYKTSTRSWHHSGFPDEMEAQRCRYFVQIPTGTHSEACGGPRRSPAAQLSPSLHNLHNPEFIYQTQVAVGVSGGKIVKVQKNALLQFVLKLVFWNHLHSFLLE